MPSKPSKTPMTPSSASRIQSTQAKTGSAGKNTFASRAQSAGQTNANKGLVGGGAPKSAGAGGGSCW
ncbi:uncharacterized protein EV420DRAFT_139658 [Desarmillaria tabescens]|uniref:SMP domain-containing protein n=1 Tax=Armillaria tabescens TaxID=1929756 RepID=A0AA39NAD0_ARMTA|nr:uncharacterized protein EV420DRAFT_139658 [Desarmillaria tabescens]KAK0461986.1 hypothetical protein EV420DRAFT_139658 [Desarmillaria tabescens]